MRNAQVPSILLLAAMAAVTACTGSVSSQRTQPGGPSTTASAAQNRPLVILTRGEPITLALRAFRQTGGGSYPYLVLNAGLDDVDPEGNPVPILSEALPQLNADT